MSISTILIVKSSSATARSALKSEVLFSFAMMMQPLTLVDMLELTSFSQLEIDGNVDAEINYIL